jgi:hypothetical protein
MKILVDSDIQQAISGCKLSKIAVAYIGADWNTFIPNACCLSAIIVSPTFGTNPWAITDLAKQIEWDKIFFLDELHAKMYIGKNSAVVGSANLTSNGLSGQCLVELCVEVDDEESLRKLNKAFEDLKSRAERQYPTEELKKARLQELEQTWGAAIANRIIRNAHRNTRAFLDFEPLGEDHFYVLWYQPADCKYSDEVKAIERQGLIKDNIHFASADNVEKNKWALLWRITNLSVPHKTEKPYWMYIHEIFENGVIDEGYDYPKCAIQRTDLEVPSPPFKIMHDVAAALKKAVQEKEIAKYLIQDGKIFSLSYSLKGIPLLMSKMKEFLTDKANAAGAKRRRG